MKKPNITKEQFFVATIENISQVYSGKRDCCRCGCGGDYISTSHMVEPRNDIEDTEAERKLERAKRLVEDGAEVDFGETYVDVKTGKNRTLTFYFDETNNPLPKVNTEKKKVVIPKEQLKLIQKALRYYVKQAKYLNSLPTEMESMELFDMNQLSAILNYDISVELSQDKIDYFSSNHGMDFPIYLM